MTVVASNNFDATPTLLALASRIRRAVTKESLVTLTDDPVNNVIVDAINDAVNAIYYSNRWNWTRTAGSIIIAAGTTGYPLPGDFHRMATEPVINAVQLKEVSLEEWWRNTYTPSWNSNASVSGQPSIYMVDGSAITFWPAPSQSFVDSNPTIPIIYYRRPGRRLDLTDGAVSPTVPPEFTEILASYGMAKLKEFLQYSDWQIDMQRHDALLLNRIQTENISVHPPRMRPRNWRTTNYG